MMISSKISENVIKENDVPLKGSTSPMVDMGKYEFKILNVRKITPE